MAALGAARRALRLLAFALALIAADDVLSATEARAATAIEEYSISVEDEATASFGAPDQDFASDFGFTEFDFAETLDHVASSGSQADRGSSSAAADANLAASADIDAISDTLRIEVDGGGTSSAAVNSANCSPDHIGTCTSAEGNADGHVLIDFELTDSQAYDFAATATGTDSLVTFTDNSGTVIASAAPGSSGSSAGVLPAGAYTLEYDYLTESSLDSPPSNSTSGSSAADVTLIVGGEAACDDVRVGFAMAEGCFQETAPGSGIFETTRRAWVGGFEILPEPGGKLVLDTNDPDVSTTGNGADVIFGGFRVPIPVDLLPVGVRDGTFEVGQVGTVTGMLGLPVESSVEVSWAADGKSSTYKQTVRVKTLTGAIGELKALEPGEGINAGGGKLTANLVNGKGLELREAELTIKELTVAPSALRVRRELKVKDILLKFERKNGKPFWTGRAGAKLPIGDGLTVIGTANVFDGSLAGIGLALDNINRKLIGPVFLQKVGGLFNWAPSYGGELLVGASIGPKVQDVRLVKIDGTAQFGQVVSDCPTSDRRPDPFKLEGKADLAGLRALAQINLVKVDINYRSCVYVNEVASSSAVDSILESKIDFLNLFGFESKQTGYATEEDISFEGNGLVRLPAFPDLDGSAIVGTTGLAACADLIFFEGGFGYRWNSPQQPTLSGCDLAPFRPGSPDPTRAPLSAGARRIGAERVTVEAGLPHVALAGKGTAGAPRLVVTGPGGFRMTTPADGSLSRAHAAVISDESAKTTTVVVDDPRAGAWKVTPLGGESLANVKVAEGLRDPKVTGSLTRIRGTRKLRLDYRLRPAPGQKVILHESGTGIDRELGVAKGRKGTITFKPTRSKIRARKIEAEVLQNGLPREVLKVVAFKAPK